MCAETIPELDLAHWRHSVAELYAAVRAAPDEEQPAAAAAFRHARDALFRGHSQSPLDGEQKAAFTGISYYPYDPASRVRAHLDPDVDPTPFTVTLPEGDVGYRRVARARFELPAGAGALTLYWQLGYGGGIFVPFGDRTNGPASYGGGRYLYDTIKGADLGIVAGAGEILLDFNYAYNPSCAYNAVWICPLAPRENKLSLPIEAGELNFELAK